MDAEDLITQALEPGERIVWSDGPHGLRGAFRVAVDARTQSRFQLASLVFSLIVSSSVVALAAVACGAVLVRASESRKADRAIQDAALLALAGGVMLVVVASFARRVAGARGDRYAVTDRGRILAVTGHELRSSVLRDPAKITTDATGDQEFGDVLVGAGLVLYAVSYPLIAVESIRAAVSAATRASPDGYHES